MDYKKIAIFLVLLCCIMGAASAAEDVSADDIADSVDDSVLDAFSVDESSGDASDSAAVEAPSEDTTTEEIIDDTQTDEISEESVSEDSLQTRGNDVNVTNWNSLRSYSQKNTANYNIYLNHIITYSSNPIIFANNVTIIGTPDNYITGGNSNVIPFQSTGSLDITFINVTFKNMKASVLIKLATTGTNSFINCSFDNITTSAYKSSVIWNDKGYMNVSGCNFTNTKNGFGAITNYATSGSVAMNVENCIFENNTGRVEPGAINNCGEMNITDSTFTHNIAAWWAGAVHTHTNAYTRIVGSAFTDNLAGGTSGTGWNGGALFSYSTLEVIDSTFNSNNCSVLTGGGAIFGYSMGTSVYNITVDGCNFYNNVNKYANGYAGAVGVQNQGYLTVCNSYFENNDAANGQAISAITKDEPYCMNCTNCSCPNCPNCTNCTHNVSSGVSTSLIYNNTFVNHDGTADTVVIAGNHYTFYDNKFINSTQSVHYNETANQYDLTDYPSSSSSRLLSHSKLGSSILGDWEKHDVIYINESSPNDAMDDNIHGSSWEDAFGTDFCFGTALDDINNGGIIYLADTDYTDAGNGNGVNCTLIGFFNRENTIVHGYSSGDSQNAMSNVISIITHINISFKGDMTLNGNKAFINCTFNNSNINTNYDMYNMYLGAPENMAEVEISPIINFTNCDFVDYDTEGSILEAFRYSQVNFINCTFKDITANSIVNNTGGFTLQDSINFFDCTFDNVNVKGIVDVPAGTNPVEKYRIEGCTGIAAGTETEGDRDYVNMTQSKPASVLATSVTDDSLVISLKDSEENAIGGADVLVSVNGAEAVPYALGDDGTLTLALGDLTDLTGPVTIAVSFEESDDFKGSSDSVDYVIRNATSIAADDLNIEVNADANLTIVLKDNNGNPLASKEIAVSVGEKNSTVITDENGVAVIPVNYAAAGVYEYSLYFAGDEANYKNFTKIVKVNVTSPSQSETNVTNGTANTTPAAPAKVATKLTAAKVSAVYGVTKKLTITLKDKNGNVLANKKVSVKVGSISKTLTTNKKGQVSLNVAGLVPKTYTATVKFAGDKSYTASIVKPKVVVSKAKVKLAAKAKTFKVKAKTKKYTVTLKNNKGKVMKKTKISLKIGKKTYTAKTNNKGVATFKVKLTKKGKNTAVVKFAGNKYFKALSKKVKIVVK